MRAGVGRFWSKAHVPHWNSLVGCHDVFVNCIGQMQSSHRYIFSRRFVEAEIEYQVYKTCCLGRCLRGLLCCSLSWSRALQTTRRWQ